MNLQKQFFKLSFPIRITIAIAIIFLIKYVYLFIMNKFFNEPFENPQKCIYFYMENCGHCKEMNPEWEKVKQNYNGNVKLVKIENKNAGLDLDKYNIKGFPTIILVDNKGNHKEFNGNRNSNDIISFINGH
jgi:thiol-disulfide isomerase/thioredoxin